MQSPSVLKQLTSATATPTSTMVSCSSNTLKESDSRPDPTSFLHRAESRPLPCAACHNVVADAELIEKVSKQKQTMSIREICQANNMRQGDVAWLLYVAPKQLALANKENTPGQQVEEPKSPGSPKSKSMFRRLQRLLSR